MVLEEKEVRYETQNFPKINHQKQQTLLSS